MGELLTEFMIFTPLYGVFVWGYFYRRKNIMWRKLYQEEPEESYGPIGYSVQVMTLVFVLFLITKI